MCVKCYSNANHKVISFSLQFTVLFRLFCCVVFCFVLFYWAVFSAYLRFNCCFSGFFLVQQKFYIYLTTISTMRTQNYFLFKQAPSSSREPFGFVDVWVDFIVDYNFIWILNTNKKKTTRRGRKKNLRVDCDKPTLFGEVHKTVKTSNKTRILKRVETVSFEIIQYKQKRNSFAQFFNEKWTIFYCKFKIIMILV